MLKSGKMIIFVVFFYFQTCMALAFTLTPYFGAYRFEGNSNIGNTFLAGFGLDYRLTDQFNAEFVYLKGSVDLNYYDIHSHACVTDKNIDTNLFHMGGHYHLMQFDKWTPYIAAGLGVIHMNTDYAEMFRNDPEQHYLFQMNYGGGIKYALSQTLTFRGDIRHLITFEHMDNDISATIGISYAFGSPPKQPEKLSQIPQKSKPDHEKLSPEPLEKVSTDHVSPHPPAHSDSTDLHQTDHESAADHSQTDDEAEAALATHDAPYSTETTTHKSPKDGHDVQKEQNQTVETKRIDSDNDGIVDAQDLCPNTNTILPVDQSGCPLDSDHDGIFDGIDKCMNTPPHVKVNMFGCAPDTDRDGILDAFDLCANTPKDVNVNKDGCPLDEDNDGVPDSQDLCPETQTTQMVNKNGCPVGVKSVDSTGDSATNSYHLIVHFDYKSATVKESYYQTLSLITQWMQKVSNPEIILSSHTDNIGSQMYNLNLSNQRAESVIHYLNTRFQIPISQMKSYSFGELHPVADNQTEIGRQKNRRVEINVVDQGN